MARIGILMCLVWASAVQGNELPTVTLVEGKNEVSLSVVNEGTVAVKGLEAFVKVGVLPSGITCVKTIQHRDVPEKSREKFVLEILVEKGLQEMTFELPIVLRDSGGQEWTFTVLATVEGTHPLSFRLMQNEPNPFNPSTTIRYELASQGAELTTLTIYNAMGQRVRTLVDEPQSRGSYAVRWDGRDNRGQKLSGGLYIYRLCSGNNVTTRKMMFIE